MTVVDNIQSILESDPTVRGWVSELEDQMTGVKYPSIMQDFAPEGTPMPYIVIRTESDVPDGDHRNRLSLSFDVFAENDPAGVKQISNRIDQLLHREKLMPYAAAAFMNGQYPIESGDPSISGRNVKIIVHHSREDVL
ncbi:hypothetical protein BTO30_13480 [Domibacillus antri]|uniref:DUF3168 domain-containing protein n=1 Tax=Domibacillus antri TaxID=1714264 RepID=A0A1Q8Q2Z2_9BACI|nr:DUF3168 domain-containing protein [Domibacillus antri]OLN21709.1 hypothetical protein BTO30_13480 [Domibacillus antri]